MQTLSGVSGLRSAVREWRSHGELTAFVPTMGNLHGGHVRLVERARQVAQRVVVSIFVNPLQFGRDEDYRTYPRTPAADALRLAELGVDVVFTPDTDEMYPLGVDDSTRVEVPSLAHVLCGAFRPGHFSGVATVVSKLFNIVQPDVALFGEKDYQQLLVIRRMVADLAVPVSITGVATVREADGLAMSSRNAYLSPEQRQLAPLLYQSLLDAGRRVAAGERDYATIEDAALEFLRNSGFRPDYFSVRTAHDLSLPRTDERELVILAAAWLGKTRLIDNHPVMAAPAG
jgi:pantoate--beta-alanine ligase